MESAVRVPMGGPDEVPAGAGAAAGANRRIARSTYSGNGITCLPYSTSFGPSGGLPPATLTTYISSAAAEQLRIQVGLAEIGKMLLTASGSGLGSLKFSLNGSGEGGVLRAADLQ
jgi:hypothetical protein